MLSNYRGLHIVEAARNFRHEHKYQPSNAAKRIMKIALVTLVTLFRLFMGYVCGSHRLDATLLYRQWYLADGQ